MFFKTFAQKQIEQKGRDYDYDIGRARRESDALRRKIKSLKWAVCESEVLRDPSLPTTARKILTEIADLDL